MPSSGGYCNLIDSFFFCCCTFASGAGEGEECGEAGVAGGSSDAGTTRAGAGDRVARSVQRSDNVALAAFAALS